MANEAAIIGLLMNAGTLTAVCSRRIYVDQADQSPRITGGSDPRSYVVVSVVVGVPQNYLGATTTIDLRRYQIDCFATTPLVARNMADAARAALESSGVMLSENPSFYDGAAELYGRSMDFSFLQMR